MDEKVNPAGRVTGRALIAAVLAAVSLEDLKGARLGLPAIVSPTRRGGTAKTREIQRYRGMTAEQIKWNEAVDAKKKARGKP